MKLRDGKHLEMYLICLEEILSENIKWIYTKQELVIENALFKRDIYMEQVDVMVMLKNVIGRVLDMRILRGKGRRGTVEPLALSGPWDPRAYKFEY